MSNTGERYSSMKQAKAAAEDHVAVTGKPYAIHQATVEGTHQGWYVLAELTWSPISVESDPEGSIKYTFIEAVRPELEADVVEVSNAALRDQMGPDPALFTEADEISDEDLEVVSISPTISPANKRIGELEQQVADLNVELDEVKAQNKQRRQKLDEIGRMAQGLLKRD